MDFTINFSKEEQVLFDALHQRIAEHAEERDYSDELKVELAKFCYTLLDKNESSEIAKAKTIASFIHYQVDGSLHSYLVDAGEFNTAPALRPDNMTLKDVKKKFKNYVPN